MTVAEQLSALSTILAQRSIHSLFQPIMCLSEQGCLAGGRRPVSNLDVCPPQCRSGFTREYGGGGNGERRVEIGQQARPFRG